MKQYIILSICSFCLLLSGCDYLDTEPVTLLQAITFGKRPMRLRLNSIVIHIIRS